MDRLEKGPVTEFALIPASYLPSPPRGRQHVCVSFVEYRGGGYELPLLVPDQVVDESLCAGGVPSRALVQSACKAFRPYKIFIKEEGGDRLYSRIQFFQDSGELERAACRLSSKYDIGSDGACYRHSLYRIAQDEQDFEFSLIQWMPEEAVDTALCRPKNGDVR